MWELDQAIKEMNPQRLRELFSGLLTKIVLRFTYTVSKPNRKTGKSCGRIYSKLDEKNCEIVPAQAALKLQLVNCGNP